jgi:hypothetical protein
VWNFFFASKFFLLKLVLTIFVSECFKFLLTSIYYKEWIFFEKFSHSNRGHRTPHAGPTRHIFGKGIGWKGHKNHNLESISGKKNIFLTMHGPYLPPSVTTCPRPSQTLHTVTVLFAPFTISSHYNTSIRASQSHHDLVRMHSCSTNPSSHWADDLCFLCFVNTDLGQITFHVKTETSAFVIKARRCCGNAKDMHYDQTQLLSTPNSLFRFLKKNLFSCTCVSHVHHY